MEFLAVGTGGFIGCCLRFLFIKILVLTQIQFPIATLISNALAGFLIGVFIALEKDFWVINPRVKLFITTGFLGGLSTFSTFNLETVDLFSAGKYMLAVGNILLNLVLSFGGVLLGILVVKLIFKKN